MSSAERLPDLCAQMLLINVCALFLLDFLSNPIHCVVLQFFIIVLPGNTVEYASPMARKVAVRPDLYTVEEVSEEEEKAAELSLNEDFEDSEMESERNNFTPALQHCTEDTDTVCKETLPDTTVLPTETWSPLDKSR
nr:unnamed protein product [Spirometra erinaceieuropaei]